MVARPWVQTRSSSLRQEKVDAILTVELGCSSAFLTYFPAHHQLSETFAEVEDNTTTNTVRMLHTIIATCLLNRWLTRTVACADFTGVNCDAH